MDMHTPKGNDLTTLEWQRPASSSLDKLALAMPRRYLKSDTTRQDSARKPTRRTKLSGSRARWHVLQKRPPRLQECFASLMEIKSRHSPCLEGIFKVLQLQSASERTESRPACLCCEVGRGQCCARLTSADARDSASTADARAWEIERSGAELLSSGSIFHLETFGLCSLCVQVFCFAELAISVGSRCCLGGGHPSQDR